VEGKGREARNKVKDSKETRFWRGGRSRASYCEWKESLEALGFNPEEAHGGGGRGGERDRRGQRGEEQRGRHPGGADAEDSDSPLAGRR
jgi:hypothetical protein